MLVITSPTLLWTKHVGYWASNWQNLAVSILNRNPAVVLRDIPSPTYRLIKRKQSIK